MSIDPIFVELTADAVRIILLNAARTAARFDHDRRWVRPRLSLVLVAISGSQPGLIVLTGVPL